MASAGTPASPLRPPFASLNADIVAHAESALREGKACAARGDLISAMSKYTSAQDIVDTFVCAETASSPWLLKSSILLKMAGVFETACFWGRGLAFCDAAAAILASARSRPLPLEEARKATKRTTKCLMIASRCLIALGEVETAARRLEEGLAISPRNEALIRLLKRCVEMSRSNVSDIGRMLTAALTRTASAEPSVASGVLQLAQCGFDLRAVFEEEKAECERAGFCIDIPEEVRRLHAAVDDCQKGLRIAFADAGRQDAGSHHHSWCVTCEEFVSYVLRCGLTADPAVATACYAAAVPRPAASPSHERGATRLDELDTEEDAEAGPVSLSDLPRFMTFSKFVEAIVRLCVLKYLKVGATVMESPITSVAPAFSMGMSKLVYPASLEVQRPGPPRVPTHDVSTVALSLSAWDKYWDEFITVPPLPGDAPPEEKAPSLKSLAAASSTARNGDIVSAFRLLTNRLNFALFSRVDLVSFLLDMKANESAAGIVARELATLCTDNGNIAARQIGFGAFHRIVMRFAYLCALFQDG